MIDRRSPTDKVLFHDAATVESVAGGRIDLALVLGSGLSSVVPAHFSHTAIPYDRMLGMPVASLEGHAGEALVGTWRDRRVLVFAGRAHLYQGFSPQQITTNVRLARATGARTVILTNAAGAVNPSYEPGDLMLIADHVNLTGRNPLVPSTAGAAFLEMSDAYAKRLRDLAKTFAAPEHRLREGVYAGVVGPTYETPAEVRFLRAAGVDAVGMSTVMETIYARAIGLDVLAISAIAGRAGGAEEHAAVVAAAAAAGSRIGDLIDRVITQL